ncbi:MAG TPA: hypothetical protein VJ810_41485, partial [Blastocatellia bacterium]|nr:hypothetical protein [Blastocatellia bacterium]
MIENAGSERPGANHPAKISTQGFAPEAQGKLAGGGAQRNHRDRDLITSSPGGAADRDRSAALSGLGGSTGFDPVVPPPANLPCASGAKICVDTLAGQFALQAPMLLFPIASSQPPLFREAAQETGLNFHHFTGSTGEFYMPEIMSAGGALFDYDNDGDLDAYL